MAAGLGFKTFTTGEVLTAADTNGYLMQGVLVFASAAARDAAITSPQEGQCCYLKDTDAVLTYSGAAWVGFDDSNAIQNTIVDAKGDIVAASGSDTPARLAVGNNGETLVADSSTATGLSYAENYAAGKNKIINGDFRFNQRAFTSISGLADTYGFDRFKMVSSGGATYTPQTFTAGTAPVAGYEGVNYTRIVTAGQTGTTPYTLYNTTIEDVRILSGQTSTISFWAKAASGTPKIALELIQVFGSGGSPSANVNTYVAQSTISTSWARYTITTTIPSISGKTVGTTANTSCTALNFWVSAGTDFNARTGSLGIQSNTFEIWGVQVEDGSVATAFNTATGTIQGELAACQRYYVRWGGAGAYEFIGLGTGATSAIGSISVMLPVQMRTAPATVDYSTLALFDGTTLITSAVPTIVSSYSGTKVAGLDATVASGVTVNRPYRLITNNSTSGFLGLSAEL